MKRQRKSLSFYLILFGFSVILVAGYSIYMIVYNGSTVQDVYVLWFMPFFFTGFYYGSDWLIEKIVNRKKKVDYEGKFLQEISQQMRDSNEFIIEEFRRLQINKTFQSDLKKAYHIYQNGEDELYNIDRLEKKYRKESLEKRAMKFVLDYLRENKKTPESE